MPNSDLQDAVFQNEGAARDALEAVHWPNGPICPHCGCSKREGITELWGKSVRPGLYWCKDCKDQFTVTVGTAFERSKVPLTKWWIGAHLFNQGKNGASAREMHRQLGVTYKTAWFMTHRLREAMADLAPIPMATRKGLAGTKQLMRALVRMKPRPHEDMKLGKQGSNDRALLPPAEQPKDQDRKRQTKPSKGPEANS